jgi:hypothetical protein
MLFCARDLHSVKPSSTPNHREICKLQVQKSESDPSPLYSSLPAPHAMRTVPQTECPNSPQTQGWVWLR